MRLGAGLQRGRRIARRVREVGLKEALRQGFLRVLLTPAERVPLAGVDRAGLFATDTEAIHAGERDKIRATSLLFDASQVEATYPEVFEQDGRFLRYAFLPASDAPRGLVVLFHGHDAFLHLGPVRPWAHFDVLAPWDTFGWRRQGSWFWGEKGDDFVARMVWALIGEIRQAKPDRPWFCMGSSMGGFGALYHGIKEGCDGIYAMCPQIDLAAKVDDYAGDGEGNPYAHIGKDGRHGLPDLIDMARRRDALPPLYLIQNQYDHVNPFARHALPLIEIYNQKNAWCGLRVHPSIGHGGDGSQDEAELFFSLILDRAASARRGAG